MKNIYMEMPKLGSLVTGVFASGVEIPNDRDNKVWHDYLAFLEAGGQPLPFDSAMEWANGEWTTNPSKKADQIASAKLDALKTIDQFHSDTVQKLVGSPTQVEKDTWSLKLEAASAITNKTTVSAAGQAFLAGAGMTTDAAKAAWAASVLAKSAGYAQVVGLAERLRDTARAAVKAATDEATLKAALDAQRAAADTAVSSLLASVKKV